MTKTSYPLIFRVDGGHIPGVSFGHVFRCLALAQELARQGVTSIFAMQDYAEGLDVVRQSGFPTIPLPRGIAADDDAVQVAMLAEQSRARGVVFDLPGIAQRYVNALPRQICGIVIDDVGPKAVYPKMIVNGTVVEAFQNYPQHKGTEYLIGGHYSILGMQFDDMPMRQIAAQAQSVVLFFGGSDPANLTTKVVASLTQCRYSCIFRVVVGPGYKNFAELTPLLDHFPGDIELLKHVDNMAVCLSECDLAVTAGGMTVYELAATGTPAIVIPSIAHEVLTADAFQQAGVVKTLGMWSPRHAEHLPDEIAGLLGNAKARQQMSRSGQHLIDRQGRRRVGERILHYLTSDASPL